MGSTLDDCQEFGSTGIPSFFASAVVGSFFLRGAADLVGSFK